MDETGEMIFAPSPTWRSTISETKLSAKVKLVAHTLSMFMAEMQPVCAVTQTQLARAASLSERSVRDCLAQLEAEGWLIRTVERHKLTKQVKHTSYTATYRHSLPVDLPAQFAAIKSVGNYEEVLTETDKSVSVAKAEKRPSRAQRNELWESLVANTGHRPQTRSEQSYMGKVVTELLEVGATPSQINAFAGKWRETYPRIDLTIGAYVKHWSRIVPPGSSEQEKAAHTARLDALAAELGWG